MLAAFIASHQLQATVCHSSSYTPFPTPPLSWPQRQQPPNSEFPGWRQIPPLLCSAKESGGNSQNCTAPHGPKEASCKGHNHHYTAHIPLGPENGLPRNLAWKPFILRQAAHSLQSKPIHSDPTSSFRLPLLPPFSSQPGFPVSEQSLPTETLLPLKARF